MNEEIETFAEQILAELRSLNNNIHTLSERLFDVQQSLDEHASEVEALGISVDQHANQLDDLGNTVFEVTQELQKLNAPKQTSTHELVDASRRSSKPWDN